MKSRSFQVTLFTALFIVLSSFTALHPSIGQKKVFATYYCHIPPGLVANLTAGGTETLGYVYFTLSATNSSHGTSASITAADIASTGCVTYTVTSISGSFTRTGTHWTCSNVVVDFTKPGAATGTVTITASFTDGILTC